MNRIAPHWFYGSDEEYAAQMEAEYSSYIKFELARLNQKYGVIESLHELSGWDIISLDRYKPGVVRYVAFRRIGANAEQKTGFAKDEVFANLQIKELS